MSSSVTNAGIRREQTTEIADETASVRISKVFTPCGARLEVHSPTGGRSIRLDALELESLSWQEREAIVGLASASHPDWRKVADSFPGREFTEKQEELHVSNEFARVAVQPLESGGGQAVRVTSPKLGYEIVLAPVELEALTRQDTELFSGFLETPFGPEATEGGH